MATAEAEKANRRMKNQRGSTHGRVDKLTDRQTYNIQ
jgi:hypothetical protein